MDHGKSITHLSLRFKTIMLADCVEKIRLFTKRLLIFRINHEVVYMRGMRYGATYHRAINVLFVWGFLLNGRDFSIFQTVFIKVIIV